MPHSNPQEPVVIAAMARTPMGGFQGALGGLGAPELGAAAIRAALARAHLGPATVDEVIFGNVLSAGLGQAPARQAALAAGLPQAVGASTINKMCGSGMQALIWAHDAIRAGSANVVVAGGMESMTNAPYLLPRARSGYRLGHCAVQDHMFLDGLEDAYQPGTLMGEFAERCADEYDFARADQDAFALESLARARAANETGAFDAEIVPVPATPRQGAETVSRDEQPFTARPEKITRLRPAFRAGGTVTAANSSSISDGAAALVLMGAGEARRRGITPLAVVGGHARHAQAPERFTTAPVGAMKKLFAATGWSAADVDLFEINEAFAVVAMAAMREFDLAHDRVNVHGGACALGHPIGASGARIVTTLIGAMAARGAARGVAAICIGGGEATALALQRPA